MRPRWRTMSLLFVLASLSVASGQSTCVEPLRRFGPPDPNHGFPLYYQDSTLLALQPCLDLACDPALAVPNPAAPVSFPDNFPSEFLPAAAGPASEGAISSSPLCPSTRRPGSPSS